MEEYPSLAEGIGLENRQVGKPARGFESLFLRHYCSKEQFFIGNLYHSNKYKHFV
jgi:hypothetical protein